MFVAANLNYLTGSATYGEWHYWAGEVDIRDVMAPGFFDAAAGGHTLRAGDRVKVSAHNGHRELLVTEIRPGHVEVIPISPFYFVFGHGRAPAVQTAAEAPKETPGEAAA